MYLHRRTASAGGGQIPGGGDRHLGDDQTGSGGGRKTSEAVTSEEELRVIPDKTISQIELSEYDSLLLPVQWI